LAEESAQSDGPLSIPTS